MPAVSRLKFCQKSSLHSHFLLWLTFPVCTDGPETPSVSGSMGRVLAIAYIDLDRLSVRILDGRVIALDPYVVYKLCCETAFPYTTLRRVSALSPSGIFCHTSSKYHDVIFTSGNLISTHVEKAVQHIAHRCDIRRDVIARISPHQQLRSSTAPSCTECSTSGCGSRAKRAWKAEDVFRFWHEVEGAKDSRGAIHRVATQRLVRSGQRQSKTDIEALSKFSIYLEGWGPYGAQIERIDCSRRCGSPMSSLSFRPALVNPAFWHSRLPDRS